MEERNEKEIIEEPATKYDDFSGVTARRYSEDELLKIFTRVEIRQLWR